MKRRVNENNNCKRRRRPPPPPSPTIGGVIACRTCSKKRAMAATWDIPIPIIIQIFNWLDQESLMNSTLVSKQSHKIICDGHGIKNKKFPMVEISPTNGATDVLLEHMCYNLADIETKNNKIRHCLHMKVNDVHKFGWLSEDEIVAITKDAQMDWILSLDVSLPPVRIKRPGNLRSLLYGLSLILPNLREIDLSNTLSCIGVPLFSISMHCPHLEKITWNNFNHYEGVHLSGHCMKSSNNLRNHHE